MTQFSIGDYIGGEFHIKNIMKGGMGAVYVVTHSRYENPIVLKTLLKIGDKHAEELFRHEAKAWIDAGTHPNIVEAFWVDVFAGHLYIAAEYIDRDENGCNTLRDRILGRHISHASLLKWSAQFCYGMMHATSHGIKAHRDIKPDNLMVDTTGDLVITDFGLVKIIENSENRPLFKKIFNSKNDLASGSGTPAYMSPEQILSLPDLDARTDMYAFGVTLYECVMGHLPFMANNLTDLLKKHINDEPNPTKTIYDKIILKCMQKNSGNRYNDFSEMLKDIENLAGQLEVKIPAKPSLSQIENESLYKKALSYAALGKRREAIEAIMMFCMRCKNDHRGWLQMGRFMLEDGDINAALEYTEVALRIDSANSHAWNNRGLIFRKLKKYDLAIESFNHALNFDPENAGAVLNKASVLSDTGRSREAMNSLEELLQRYPTKASVWHNLGVIKLEINDNVGAAVCFQNALKYDPTLEMARHGLAEATVPKKPSSEDYTPDQLIKLISEEVPKGNYEEAAHYLAKLKEFSDFYPTYILLKCQVMRATGYGSQAIKLLYAFLKSNEDFDAGWFVLGEICMAEGQKDNAQVAYKNARNILIKKSPDSQNLHDIEERLAKLQ